MKVYITLPTASEIKSWEATYAIGFIQELSAHSRSHRVVDDPKAADLVVLMESNAHKTKDHIMNLLNEDVVVKFAAKTVAINYEDTPAGFLQGLYTSLEGGRWNPSLHKSWPALHLPNEEVYDMEDSTLREKIPKLLFSFVGAMSHPLRHRLLSLYENQDANYSVKNIHRWFDHNADEKHSYLRTILDSNFVICPRGHACYTHRISETMAMGRVPVVLADNWIPFSISESDYYLRCPESEIEHLEDYLESHRAKAREQGFHARQVWLKYFSRKTRCAAAIDAAAELTTKRSQTFCLDDYLHRWNSLQFNYANRMTLPQRVWKRMTHRAGKASSPAHA